MNHHGLPSGLEQSLSPWDGNVIIQTDEMEAGADRRCCPDMACGAEASLKTCRPIDKNAFRRRF